MSRYRKIDPRIWNDKKFNALSDAGKLVFFMLLTHPSMTALGAMRATLAGLAEELGWEPEAFREAFREGCSKGMAEHDAKACFVALPNFLKYNPPESPNVIKAWVSALDMLPECGLKTRAVARAKAFAEGMTEGFAKALPEAFAKAMPYQEQEQEQELEQEEQEQKQAKPKKKRRPAAPAASIEVPDWVPTEEWLGYVEMRKRKRAPLTERAAHLVFLELEKLKSAGHPPGKVLDRSTRRGWTDVFPLPAKDEQGTQNGRKPSLVERAAQYERDANARRAAQQAVGADAGDLRTQVVERLR